MVIIVSSILVLLILYYLILDYYGPKVIKLNKDKVFGISCLRGNGLMVHEYDSAGNLFASRGLSIYQLVKGDDEFTRLAHLNVGISIFWLNNFSLFRQFVNKQECIELTVGENGNLCAFSAGYMFYWNNEKKKFNKSFKLPHFGMGIGRGIMNTGLLNANDDRIYIGEYFRNDERVGVDIIHSPDFGRTWNVSYKFKQGQIRHVHAVQKDPYTGRLWVCTGDEDHESMIAYSDDYFKTIDTIGHGSQMWRTCQLVFTEEAIYWGTDTGTHEVSGIYKWNKQQATVHKLMPVPGAIFFGTKLTNGNLIMSTDRENFPNEKDDKARLYVISKEDSVTEIECGKWKNRKLNFKFGFAKSRFQRNQGGNYLAVNFINQKAVESSDLYMISEEELEKVATG